MADLSPAGRALYRQLTAADWARIRTLAASISPNNQPAALGDLSVPLRIGCCPAGEETRFNGYCAGYSRDGRIAILVWEMTESDRRQWRAR